jgi:hypothetical protein
MEGGGLCWNMPKPILRVLDGKGHDFSPNIEGLPLHSVIIAAPLLSSLKTRCEFSSLLHRVLKVSLIIMPALPESRAAFQHRWEPYKETLRRLFLVEKKSLKEVGELMAESYDFKAT